MNRLTCIALLIVSQMGSLAFSQCHPHHVNTTHYNHHNRCMPPAVVPNRCVAPSAVHNTCVAPSVVPNRCVAPCRSNCLCKAEAGHPQLEGRHGLCIMGTSMPTHSVVSNAHPIVVRSCPIASNVAYEGFPQFTPTPTQPSGPFTLSGHHRQGPSRALPNPCEILFLECCKYGGEGCFEDYESCAFSSGEKMKYVGCPEELRVTPAMPVK